MCSFIVHGSDTCGMLSRRQNDAAFMWQVEEVQRKGGLRQWVAFRGSEEQVQQAVRAALFFLCDGQALDLLERPDVVGWSYFDPQVLLRFTPPHAHVAG